MSLTVSEKNSQLVVDSRLIAEELGIYHSNLIETIKAHQTEIEQDFGIILFETGKLNTAGRPTKLAFLTEDQATYVMTLSRNTDQVRLAKRNLVKAFSAARLKLQQQSTVDSDLLAALMSKMQNFEAIAAVSQEYLSVRKFADKNFPGYNQITDAMVETQRSLPAAVVMFTAPEWIAENAPHLTPRQKRSFCVQLAALYRSMVGTQPVKCERSYRYTNRHEVLFQQALKVAEELIPKRSLNDLGIPIPDDLPLTDVEQLIIGQSLTLREISLHLGKELPNTTGGAAGSLTVRVKHYITHGLVDSPRGRHGKKYYKVTPLLIQIVKNFVVGVEL